VEQRNFPQYEMVRMDVCPKFEVDILDVDAYSVVLGSRVHRRLHQRWLMLCLLLLGSGFGVYRWLRLAIVCLGMNIFVRLTVLFYL